MLITLTIKSYLYLHSTCHVYTNSCVIVYIAAFIRLDFKNLKGGIGIAMETSIVNRSPPSILHVFTHSSSYTIAAG